MNRLPSERQSSFARLTLVFIILIYLGFAFATAATRAPYSDEAWFASPALDLLKTGHMGTQILLPNGMAGKGTLSGIQQHTYWVMPLDPVLEAGWYRVVGFSLMAERSLSIVFGLIVLLSWFVLLERLTADRSVAILGTILLALDHIFIYHSADGRMDMTCTGFGFAGLATFMVLRERRLGLALLAANILVCASLFTHPNGILAFAGLVFLVFYFDRPRLKWQHLATLTPYVAGLIAYGLYILQNPSDYLAQIHANGSGRFSGFVHPLAAVQLEVTERYLHTFGLAPSSTIATKIKVLILFGYLSGVILAVSIRRIRRASGTRPILLLLGIYMVIMTFFNFKLEHYLINVLPMFAGLLAIVACMTWRAGFVLRLATGMAIVAIVAVQLATITYRVVRLDTYHRQYLPAVVFLKSIQDGQTVTGDPSFAFGLGFDQLQQDDTVGYWSGQVPQVLIRTSPYAEEQMTLFEKDQPAIATHISQVLSRDMALVYDQSPYRIYRRR